MSRAFRTLVIALATLPALGFTSCQPRPNVPEQVEVIVEKYRDLPSWATDQLVVPHAIDGSVGARVQSEKERGVTIDLANCHRRLLAKLDKGEAVDKRECDR